MKQPPGKWTISRLREPSTWAGLATIFGAIAAVPSPATPYLLAAAGVCGGFAVVFKEKGPPPPASPPSE